MVLNGGEKESWRTLNQIRTNRVVFPFHPYTNYFSSPTNPSQQHGQLIIIIRARISNTYPLSAFMCATTCNNYFRNYFNYTKIVRRYLHASHISLKMTFYSHFENVIVQFHSEILASVVYIYKFVGFNWSLLSVAKVTLLYFYIRL